MKITNYYNIIIVFWVFILKQTLAVCPPGYIIKPNETACTEFVCPDGQFYESTKKVCQSCDHTCSKCKFFSNYCSECKSGFYLYNQSCLTDCPETKTYVSCTNNVCQCKPCHSSCFQCYGEKNTQCLQCYASFYLNEVNTSCKDQCEDGYTKKEIQVGDTKKLFCTLCDTNCRTCDQNDGKKCLSCKENRYLLSNQCVDTCPSKYYKLNGICKACPVGCLECYANDNTGANAPAEKCLSCTDNFTLSYEDQQCSINCPSGFVSELSTKSCKPCHPSCKNCSDQTDEGCAQCQNGFTLISASPSKCENRCSSGNYSNNSLCLSCNTSCSECFGSDSKQCIKCKQDYYLYKTQCVIICPITYSTFARKYADQKIQPICDYCPIEMEQCEQDKTDLTLIKPVLCKKGYYLEDGKCVKKCKDLIYYTDETSRACLPCKFPCLQCLSDTVCLTCATYKPSGESLDQQYILVQITKNSDTGVVYQQNCLPTCPDGYFQNGSVCDKCHQNCKTCTGSNEQDCITCQKYDEYNQLYKNTNQCFYICPLSDKNPLYGDKDTQSCLPCSKECASCFKGNNQSCYSCVEGYFLEYLKPECKSFCSAEGTYENSITRKCTLCGFGCLTCYEGLFNSCITCQNGYYLQQEYNVCNPCPKQCSSCTSDTQCQSCNSGYFYQQETNSCIISCPLDGYYANTDTNKCEKCDSTCFECYGGSAQQCISCPKGRYLGSSGQCAQCTNCDQCTGPNLSDCLSTSTCPQNQYLFDGKCLTCFDSCTGCSGTTYDSCINCKSNDYQLLFDICKKKDIISTIQCDIGFFYNPSDQKCYSCHKNCIECTGKSSSQCTKCADGFLLHKEINTCYHTCMDGYIQTNPSIMECEACLYNCNTGCSKGYYFLIGLCFNSCPFGTTGSQNNCVFNSKPEIKFAVQLGQSVNNNSEAVKIQLQVYSLKQYSINWSLMEGSQDVTSGPLSKYIKNRSSYIVFPQKSLKSNTQYTIKASIFDTSSSCQSVNDCTSSQTFKTMNDIVQGSFDIEIDKSTYILTLIVSGWTFSGSIDTLQFDLYVKLIGNDYFFFEKGKQYTDGRFTYFLPNLNFELSENKAQFFIVVYNDNDISLQQKKISLNISRVLAFINIDISEFVDSLYTQITTLQQIQRASFQYFTQMSTLIQAQTSSQTIFNRHLFYQAYFSIKGVQLECDSAINCSGNGTCSWNQLNHNEVECLCNKNFGGRYCEFESYQLDVAKQHLIMLIQKLENIVIESQNDLFLSIEVLLNLSSFYSIFDEFTLNTLVDIYFKVFDQLKRIQTHISDEKILFKISRLTSQLIHLINEIETLSFSEQQQLLMKTMAAFDTQINLFLQNFSDSYDELKSQQNLQTSFTTDVSQITVSLLYENELLDAYIKNSDRPDNDEKGQIKMIFQADQISFAFDLGQFSPKQSLSTAIIKWKSNPFLSYSEYYGPFISCITKLIAFSEESPVEISTVDSQVEIAIPKIISTPTLRTSRPYLQPYSCVYFDQVAQSYKQDGVQYMRENSTHVICSSEQISGNYGVIVNQDAIDPNLALSEIWNATSSLYANDKLFIEFMNKQLNKQTEVTDNEATVSESNFDPNLQLIYAIILYAITIFLFIIISLIKDKRDTEHHMKEADSYWLIHPIYSLICGPYSTFFPRVARSFNFAQLFINLFLFNSIFVRVYSLPTQEELNDGTGKRQITSFLIGLTSIVCSIIVYYATICVVNFYKMRWYMSQKWLDFKEDKITNEIVESVLKSLKWYHLINYGLIFLLQVGMGVPIIILILTANKQQNQFFFTSLFASWMIDQVLDTIILIGFCFIRIFSRSDKSNLVLFFTLRGFYFPTSEFHEIETKIKQYISHGEVQGEEGNESDDEIFELEEDHGHKKIFKRNDNQNKDNQEEVQLTEFVNKLETKM